jgi:hypothetical protein
MADHKKSIVRAINPIDAEVVVSLPHRGEDVVPAEWCAEVRWILDPRGERTAPAPLYWAGHAVPWAGKSPTDGEGEYLSTR